MNSINWPAPNIWVFIAQLVEHCSNFVEGSGGWWLAFIKCASVKCRRNICSCINTTFLDLHHQPLHAVIDFTIRLRILGTMFRISRLFPFWNSHFKGSKIFIVTIDVKPLLSRTITQQIRINFSEEDLNVFSLPTKSCVHPIKTWFLPRVHAQMKAKVIEKKIFFFFCFMCLCA